MERWLCIKMTPIYKPGDPPPEGYLEKAEWAHVQLYHRIPQKRCHTCKLYVFPNERCACGITGGNVRSFIRSR